MLPQINYSDEFPQFQAIAENNKFLIVSALLTQSLQLDAAFSQQDAVLGETIVHAAVRLNKAALLSEILNSRSFESHTKILTQYAVYYCGNQATPVPYTPQELASVLRHEECATTLKQYQQSLDSDLASTPNIERKSCLA